MYSALSPLSIPRRGALEQGTEPPTAPRTPQCVCVFTALGVCSLLCVCGCVCVFTALGVCVCVCVCVFTALGVCVCVCVCSLLWVCVCVCSRCVCALSLSID